MKCKGEKMERKKTLLTFLTIVLLVFLILGIHNNSYAGIKTPNELQTMLNNLRNVEGFREGDTFNAEFAGATQCHGWALKLTNELFGTNANTRPDLWTDISYPSVTADDLCIGDIVRYRATETYDHSIVVIDIKGDTIYYADCNWGEGCFACSHPMYGNSICWNRSITKSELNAKLNNYCIEVGHTNQLGRIIHHKENDVKSFEEKPTVSNLGDNFTAVMIFSKDKTGNTIISANGTTANSNVEISTKDKLWKKNQLWSFERQSDGSYYIKNVASDLYLDVDNEETENGTNIKLYNYSASNAQKWYIIEVKGGGYRLIPKHCYDTGIKRGLDIDAGGTTEGTNVHLWEYLGNADENTGNQVINIKNAFYCEIEDLGTEFTASMIFKKDETGNSLISANGITKESNVEISKQEGILKENQLWNFERQSDGSYYIKNVASDLYLDVDDEKTENGTNIKVYTYSKSSAQKWYIVKVDDRYRLIPKHCYEQGVRACLDIDTGATEVGTNIHLWEFLGEANDLGKTQVIYIEKNIPLKGDINGDGIINILDITYGYVKLEYDDITDEELERGDVTGEGIYNISDINKVFLYLEGKIDEM